MATSPLLDAEGMLRIVVTSDGIPIPDAALLFSVTVRTAINQVPRATLVFADGDLGEQGFWLSGSAYFRPGAAIEVKAGYGDTETKKIFSGIVVCQGLNITLVGGSRLTIECRDKAMKMTVGRKNAQYLKTSDADVITQLVEAHALTAKVAPTTTVHDQLIQHHCSDWDYMLARAEASGCLVVVRDGTVEVAAPHVSGVTVLSVAYGTDLIEFDADLDASDQHAEVRASAWSSQSQALAYSDSHSPAELNAHGNLDSATLAKVLGRDTLTLQTGAPLPKEALDAWARAHQLKAGLSRLRGHMRFQGSALAEVGKLVDVQGVGERFSGDVFATGVTHQLDGGNWTTAIDFGLPVAWVTEAREAIAPTASGRGPGIEGLHMGVVLKLDEDPGGEYRVQVKVPSAGVDSVWARLLQVSASNAFGALFAPEIGDEVLLGWFDNDPGYPVVLGSLYSSKHPPPTPLTARNEIKTLVTRCGAKLEFNDEDRVITLLTPGNNKMVFSDQDKAILIADQNGNQVELGIGGIKLDSPKDITISAKGAITIGATGGVRVSSKADVDLNGLNVNCMAQVGMVAKGLATAELSASGQTIVKGAIVMIN